MSYRLAGSGLVLLVIVFILSLVPVTQRWLVKQSINFIPELSITQLKGSFWQSLELKGVRFSYQGVNLQIDSIKTDINFSALLNGKLHVSLLAIRGGEIKWLPRNKKSTKGVPEISFSLPFPIELSLLSIDNMRYSQGSYPYRLKHLALAASMQKSHLELRDINLAYQDIKLMGKVDVDFIAGLPFTTHLNLIKPLNTEKNWQSEIHLHGHRKKIQLNIQLQSPYQASAVGVISLSKNKPVMDVLLHWDECYWPLKGKKQYRSYQGKATILGSFDDYKFIVSHQLMGVLLPTSTMRLQGRGNKAHFNIAQLNISSLEGTVRAAGHIDWQDSLQGQLRFVGRGLQLAQWHSDYPRDVSFTGELDFAQKKVLSIALKLEKLSAVYRHQKLSGQTKIRYIDRAIMVDELVLFVGKNQLQAQGNIGQNNYLSFSVHAPELAQLSDKLSGSIQASGRVNGELTHPEIQLKLNAQAIHYQKISLAAGKLNVQIGANSEKTIAIQLTADLLQIGDIKIKTVHSKVSGTQKQHQMRFKLVSNKGRIDSFFTGEWNEKVKIWSGYVNKFSLFTPEIKQWFLAKTAPLTISRINNQVNMSTDFCLLQAKTEGRFCLDLGLLKGKVHVLADIQNLPLAIADYWVHDNVHLVSQLQAKIKLDIADKVAGDMQVYLDSGYIEIAEMPIQLKANSVIKQDDQRVYFQGVVVNARLDKEHVKADCSVLFNQQNSIACQLLLTHIFDQKPADITGSLTLNFTDLQAFDRFSQLDILKGELLAAVKLRGKLNTLKLEQTSFSLSHATIIVPDVGLSMRKTTVDIIQQDKSTWTVLGKADIGGEQAQLVGTLQQGQAGNFLFELSLKGKYLKLVQLSDKELWLSPDLHIKGNDRKAVVTGVITVPEAKLFFNALPENAVSVSQDEVLIREQERVDKKSSDYKVSGHLFIVLGNKVALEGFGLKTKLQGKLKAIVKNNKVTLFNQLNLKEGRYQAYGQDLSIKKGEILFHGDIENPSINLLAYRKASDWNDKTVAYIGMTGALKHPVTCVYTEPSLPEGDALAYLLTGGSLDKNGGGSNAILIAKAALGLGRDYVDSVMGIIGIDELEIKSTQIGQNSLVLGKRVNNDWYVRYIMDVLTAQMQFAVAYKINQHFSIETRTGSTQSGDIKYSVEF